MIQTLFGTVEQEPTLLEKLKSGVQKTRAGLVTALEDALQGRKEIDADLLFAQPMRFQHGFKSSWYLPG